MSKKKGFTIIELIVVIAILGVLVLLAAPKFLEVTSDAKMVQVKNDVKAHEAQITADLMGNSELMRNWPSVNSSELSDLNNSGKVLNKKGKVVSNLGGQTKLVPNDYHSIKTSLEGRFIWSNDEVFYYDENLKVASEDIYYAKDSDFEWIESPGNDKAYSAVNEDEIGFYSYIGEGHEIVAIPEYINGTKLTKYTMMFGQFANTTGVKKIISNNKDIVDAYGMFMSYQGETLDLTEFDVSGLENVYAMFTSTQLKELDITNWDTSNVTNFSGMFLGNVRLEKIKGIEDLNTSNSLRFDSTFKDTRISDLDLSKWNTSKSVSFTNMFEGLTSNNVKINFNGSSLFNTNNMFKNATIETVDLSEFIIPASHERMYDMFKNSQITTVYANDSATALKYKNSPSANQSVNYTTKP